MTVAEAAPAWLVVVLLGAAGAGRRRGWLAVADFEHRGRRGRLTGIAAIASAGIGWDAWQPVALAIGLLAVGTPMFGAGWLGGGDVKLLAASGLWFSLRRLADAGDGGDRGGLLTLIILLARRLTWSDQLGRRVILQRRGGIPYGIAIAIGVAATVVLARAPAPPVSAAPSTSLQLPR